MTIEVVILTREPLWASGADETEREDWRQTHVRASVRGGDGRAGSPRPTAGVHHHVIDLVVTVEVVVEQQVAGLQRR